jgi:hypothetical protein
MDYSISEGKILLLQCHIFSLNLKRERLLLLKTFITIILERIIFLCFVDTSLR